MNLVYWVEPKLENAVTNITKIRITRATRADGTFEQLAVISPAQVAGIWITEYIDVSGEKQHWYIAEFCDDTFEVFARSDPRKGEYTFGSAIELMWRLRTRIGDMQTPYCYKDYELLGHLNEARLTVGKTLTFDNLQETHETMIMWVAMHQICLELATDSAKYYNLSIEGVVINKAERVTYYTELAQKYWDKYIFKRDEWAEGDKQRSGTIIETYMTRESGTTGRRVPYIFALPPEPVRLSIGKITSATVELRWTQSLDPGYYYYMIFRSSQPNQQQNAIEDIYHKRIAALYNDLTDYTPLWGGITTPIKMIFRNSVTYWQDQNRPGLVNPNYPGGVPMLWPGRTYYYVVGVVNKNILIALSQEVKVTLPALTPPNVWNPIYAIDGIIQGNGEPTATVDIWRNIGAGYAQLGTVVVKPGYPTWQYGVGITVGHKFKAKQIFNSIDSGFGTEYTAI